MVRATSTVAGLALASSSVALSLDVNDLDSVKAAAAEIAKGIYIYHDPAATTGHFRQPQPWFWWLSGSGWNGLMDYTVYTGDTTYQGDLLSAIAQNVGPKYDFCPPEQANWEANDDQMYWVYNALTALEYDFEPLPCEGSAAGAGGDCASSWLAISTNAFEQFAARWNNDSATCGGGLKWQFNPSANGYTYKNSVTNGGFFQTAARLARYTGNQTFADWATRIWDWSTAVGLVRADHRVFDGAGDEDGANCTSVNDDEWSYNVATYTHGAAHMYAATGGDQTWEARVQGLVDAAQSRFFGPADNATGVMYEQLCEPFSTCNVDQTSFKASLSRWLGKTAVLVPSVRAQVVGLLEATAVGAATSCDGHGNATCGMKWYVGGFDGKSDFGVQLSALEAVTSLLAATAPPFAVAPNRHKAVVGHRWRIRPSYT
ncbi:glycoside hydrolase family 76 protein [Durotheca rogersii]|uniref:glycoside hydrolase family 76 protein n=1 Tax=Durotheca rogersii TaxID=419775 RepID=UPI00221EB85A|nr:glycoside hydrolase family 76 protein [Durotheca rogersii]KAI5859364.1 glycoside hydrolase family 76 protein [Durotheca rogersii]